MNEKDIDEPIDYSDINTQKDSLLFSKKKNNSDSESLFTIVIHLPNHKIYSFEVSQNWNTKKLISFIKSTFKLDFTKSTPIFIFHGNLLSPISETPLKEIFQLNKINHIVITIKKQNLENIDNNFQNNLNSKTNKEVFKTEEFCEMEKNIIDDYFKIFKNNSINNFPFMSPVYNLRRKQIPMNSTLERLAAFEPQPLEEFPARNYFQFHIIFKCIISFFAFGIYIKGFNFVLFLSVLIGYYWYCINNIIDEFYKKKIQEIGITEQEYRDIKNGGILKISGLKDSKGFFVIDNENENEENEEENEQNNKEDKKETEKNDTNINREANNIIKNDIEEDEKDEDKKDKKFNEKETLINNLIYRKEEIKDLNDKNNEKEKADDKNDNEKAPLLNSINEILIGNKLRGQNNNNNFNNTFESNVNNNNGINDLFNNNNIKKKDENEQVKEQEHEEIPRESTLVIILEIIKMFFISFIPALCDEFEANNPIPVNNHNHDHNQEGNNENNINNNNNDNNINDNNINNNNNNIFNNNFFNNNNNNINNNFNNNNENNDNQEDDSNNNKMTSSKVVNISEDSNRDNRMFKLIKRDNQSANENEYVFSEHGGIDNLSMNSELYKQKREKEKEKEKEEKDKEKQIFEEDEEYLIEEDKKEK